MKTQFSLPLILLLLYETTCSPWSNTLESSPTQTASQVPVWAKKAGFHLKPRLTPDQVSDSVPSGIRIGDQNTSEGKSKEIGMNEGIPPKDNLFGEDNKGGNKHDVVQLPQVTRKPRMEKVVSESKQKHNWNRNRVKEDQQLKDISQQDDEDEDENESNNYGESDYENEDEPECPENQYWHLRGRRCVPVLCPGGNHWRDTETGECILRRYRGSGKWRKKYNKKFGVPSKNVGGLSGRWMGG